MEVSILAQHDICSVTSARAITPGGTTDLSEVAADKADESCQARFRTEVFEVEGDRPECEPLLVELVRGPSSARYSACDAVLKNLGPRCTFKLPRIEMAIPARDTTRPLRIWSSASR